MGGEMKNLRKFAAAAMVLPFALTACSSDKTETKSAAKTDAVITANSSEPQNPLVPANTNEVGGGSIVDVAFAGLQYYDEKGEAKPDVAESIETKDNQKYTVKIKKNQKFSDGSPLTASSFVDAWNQAVKQNMNNASFFESIKGYGEALADAEKAVNEKRPSGVGEVNMSGLKVVDDTTFTVELEQPESDFPLRLGYSAFFPLPKSGLGDPATVAKYGEQPVSNGPYMVKKGSWEHNVKIDLVPNPKYNGPRKVKNGGLTLKFYAGLDAAYNDLLAGNLDVLDAVPDSAFGTFEKDLAGRSVNKASAIFQSFTLPANLEHFQGEEGKLRKQAISMAINRGEITKTIFKGTRTPATDFVSPVIPGHNGKLKGNEVLKFNPKKAKELWAKADAIKPWSGSFAIAYNSDGGHQAWVDAVANSVKNVLGIDAKGAPYADFKSLRDDVTNRKIKTGFRTGWQADYPSPFNFLGPLYATKGSANDGDYSNPKFDALLKKVLNTSDSAAVNKLYDQAQEMLLTDLPAFPLWYSNVAGGWADGVKNVKFNWKSKPIYEEITK
ncbi:ABC transporter substrate-binding protein [Arcanobacterium sp. S3PF19]|nr:ABC transporter substrate-binding protein [Arcanobacterium sp. S3PF19]